MAVNIFRLLGSVRSGFKQRTIMIAVLTLIFLFWYTTSKIQLEEIESLKHQTLTDERQNDLGNELAWMSLQEERKAAVKEACKDIPKEVLYQTILTTQESRDQLVVDDRHNVIYCYIPKVDSLNWSKTWIFLNGMMNNISDFSPDMVKLAFEKNSLKYTKNVDELKHKFETYTKVIVVRHPFERLLSSYLDEIQIPKLAEWVLPTVQKKRPNATVTDIKWPEFVEFIIKEGVIGSKSWLTYEDLCHPCALDYDVIVKFETFNQDSSHFLKRINATESLPISDPTPDNSSLVDLDNRRNYLAVLSERQMEVLRRKYNRDFLLFQYH